MLALINQPSLILLDEPVTSLDDASSHEFWKTLAELKHYHTIVVITHNINPAVEIADYCAILHSGKLVSFTLVNTLRKRSEGLIVLRAIRDTAHCHSRLNSISETSQIHSLSDNHFFKEKIVESTDLRAFYTFLRDNPNMILSAAPVSLESLIVYLAQATEQDYSMSKRRDISLLLQKEISLFTSSNQTQWCRQIGALFARRSRLLWLGGRNYGSVLVIFVAILMEGFLLKMKYEFIPYRIIVAYSAIAVEESVQRSYKKFYLVLDTSGISSFQYQLSNLLANSTFFLFVYFFLYLLLETCSSLLQINFDRLPFVLMLFLGIVATVSFTQLLSLFFNDPAVSAGIFILIVSYYSYFVFSLFFPAGYFLPNMFFCFAITKYFSKVTDPPDIHSEIHLSRDQLALTLILQILISFTLAVLLDKIKRKGCRSSSNRISLPLVELPAISAHFTHPHRFKQYQFEVEQGSVTSILGPNQSGKSELVNLLIGSKRFDYKGKCFIKTRNLLAGQQLPSNEIGVCLEEENLEETFTLFYHLCFLGQLKGLSNSQMLRQIFYLTKLFDMEDHLFKKIDQLSGGNMRKAALSAALLGAPSLLIVDEPTRSLDPAVSHEILIALHFLVHRLGHTFVFSSKKAKQTLLIADSAILLTSPWDKVKKRITDERIQELVGLQIRYSLPPEEHQACILIKDIRQQLKQILMGIAQSGGELLELRLTLLNQFPDSFIIH